MFWVICKVINGVVRAVPDQKSRVLWAQLNNTTRSVLCRLHLFQQVCFISEVVGIWKALISPGAGK